MDGARRGVVQKNRAATDRDQAQETTSACHLTPLSTHAMSVLQGPNSVPCQQTTQTKLWRKYRVQIAFHTTPRRTALGHTAPHRVASRRAPTPYLTVPNATAVLDGVELRPQLVEGGLRGGQLRGQVVLDGLLLLVVGAAPILGSREHARHLAAKVEHLHGQGRGGAGRGGLERRPRNKGGGWGGWEGGTAAAAITRPTMAMFARITSTVPARLAAAECASAPSHCAKVWCATFAPTISTTVTIARKTAARRVQGSARRQCSGLWHCRGAGSCGLHQPPLPS